MPQIFIHYLLTVGVVQAVGTTRLASSGLWAVLCP